MTTYGYARVSTKGQSLKIQMQDLKDAGVANKNIFHEKVSGAKHIRPQLHALLDALDEGDTLVVTKLDRLARNTSDALRVLDDLHKKNIKVHVLNLGYLDNSAIGKLTTNILLSVAEMERDMIAERMDEGKRYAKKHNPNYREGRPRATKKSKVNNIPYDVINEYLKTSSIRKTAEHFNISTSTVQHIKKLF